LYKWITLITLMMPSFAWSQSCEQYQYSNLSIVQVLIEKEGAISSLKLYVSWNEENAIGTWMDNQPIAGSIKKPLKEYFNIKHIDKINILNSLGSNRWNAFSHHYKAISKLETKDIWYLKKCKNT